LPRSFDSEGLLNHAAHPARHLKKTKKTRAGGRKKPETLKIAVRRLQLCGPA
jgi:hypothetical protein